MFTTRLLELLQRPEDECGRGDADDEEREEGCELRVLAALGVLRQVPQLGTETAEAGRAKVLVDGALPLALLGVALPFLSMLN